MPKLSVILPVYNAGPPLNVAVQSTLASLPKDSEILALDDGSSDGSRELLFRLSERDRRLKVSTNDVNLGVARSLNLLLDSCDSGMVARMDADDVMLPWRLVLERRSLLSLNSDVVFSTALHYVPDRRRLWPQRLHAVTTRVAPFLLLLGNPFVHSTMLATTEALRAVGGYRDVPSEDYDLWMRLALADRRITRLALPTLVYRHHAGQVTSRASWVVRARTEPRTAAVHAELAERLLAWRGPVFADLRGMPDSQADLARVATFVDRLSRRAAELSLGRSAALRREIKTRSAWLDESRRRLQVRHGGE